MPQTMISSASLVLHHGLPGYLSDDLERIQKRALSIISPYLSYCDSLITYNIGTPKDKRQKISKNLFDNAVHNKDHMQHHLLPENTPHHIISEDTVLLTVQLHEVIVLRILS